MAFRPCTGWRILVLDSYHEAVIGRDKSSQEYQNAVAAIQKVNPNDITKPGNWLEGLKGRERCAVPFNGGLGVEQLGWLRQELCAARNADEHVLLLSHALLHPDAGNERWLSPPKYIGASRGHNYTCAPTTQVMDPLLFLTTKQPCRYWETRGTEIELLSHVMNFICHLIQFHRTNVVAVFCGHDHKGGYFKDAGIHHFTFKSPLNQGATGMAFGVVELFSDGLKIKGPDLDEFLCVPGSSDDVAVVSRISDKATEQCGMTIQTTKEVELRCRSRTSGASSLSSRPGNS